jgi:hypothetical protein
MSNEKTTSGGIGFFGAMFLLFLGLKLTNYIDWSWWWVTSPLWLPTAVIVGFIAIAFLIALIFNK